MVEEEEVKKEKRLDPILEAEDRSKITRNKLMNILYGDKTDEKKVEQAKTRLIKLTTGIKLVAEKRQNLAQIKISAPLGTPEVSLEEMLASRKARSRSLVKAAKEQE